MHYKTTDPTKADSSCCTIFLTGEAIQDSKPFSSACFIAQNVLAAGTFVPPPLEETYSSTETIQALAYLLYMTPMVRTACLDLFWNPTLRNLKNPGERTLNYSTIAHSDAYNFQHIASEHFNNFQKILFGI